MDQKQALDLLLSECPGFSLRHGCWKSISLAKSGRAKSPGSHSHPGVPALQLVTDAAIDLRGRKVKHTQLGTRPCTVWTCERCFPDKGERFRCEAQGLGAREDGNESGDIGGRARDAAK